MENFINNVESGAEVGEIIKNKIYTIRGQRVMLDFDLAEIYGYETKAFNRQVKNNLAKFEGEDFMFRLTREEVNKLSRCNFCTLNGRGSNIKYLPYVFTESGISPVILDFSQQKEQNEFLFLNGELAKASETYIEIYAKAKKNIFVIDNYIGIKTLRHLQKIKKNVSVTIFSDNIGRCLHARDYLDFQKEFPEIKIKFLRNENKIHDRFIVLDFGEKDERIFHCGASAKDAGGRLSAINEFDGEIVKRVLDEVLEKMLKNPRLELK